MTTAKEPLTRAKPASFLKSVLSQLKPQRHSEAPANKPSDQFADPTRIGVLSDEPERRTSLNSSASRCQFTFADGRQCSNPAKVYQQDELSPVRDRKVNPVQLCAHHTSRKATKPGAKGAAFSAPELEALCSDLTTATNINRALAQTFLLMAQGRISRKDAVTFGYLSQLLLQTVPGIRSEFVSAFGYRQWEQNLKSSLDRIREDDPPPSPQNPTDEPDGVILSESGPADERRISPNPYEQAPSPDYGSLLRRSLDMLDRKYDTTPEGRCEAQKLSLELELMKPAPAKPPRDYFGRVVELTRRLRDAEQQESDGASIPPAVDYYGHPIKTHVVPPPWADKQDALPPARGTATPGSAHSNPSALRSEPPAVPDPKTCSSGRGETIHEAQRSCAPSASEPADFVAPPSRRHRKQRSHSSAPGCAPHSELPLSLPISATTARHDSVGGPDAEHHEGHRTDWYPPLSWSKTRPHDPFPKRTDNFLRKLRSMTNAGYRRWQHCNSRGL